MGKLHLIRGKRILQQLEKFVTETTFDELSRKASRLPTKKREYAVDPIQITQMKMIPMVPSNALQINSLASNSGKKYETVILFDNVAFLENDADPSAVTFVGADNAEYNIREIKLASTNVKVRCDCMDFHWRFAEFNAKDGSLHGKPPTPHVSQTDRAPVNPEQVPGVCKHLLKTVAALRDAGLTD